MGELGSAYGECCGCGSSVRSGSVAGVDPSACSESPVARSVGQGDAVANAVARMWRVRRGGQRRCRWGGREGIWSGARRDAGSIQSMFRFQCPQRADPRCVSFGVHCMTQPRVED